MEQQNTSSKLLKGGAADDSLPTIHPVIYPISWALVWIYYHLGGWKVHGKENVPRKGAVIFAANHVSLLDPPAVNLAAPRVPRTMAKSELFDGRVAWLMRGLGAFPVRRGKPDRAAMRRALKVLEAGMVLSVFPEGTRSRDGELGIAGPGFSYLVHTSKVPVIPIFLQGNEQTLSPPHPKFRLVRGQVWFGEMLHFEEQWQQKATREALDTISERVMAAIAALRAEALEKTGRK
jgi:1-acyl-sn-glycerol-3-phosphate acyltransferase